jgi:hypothetical protein
LSVCMQKPADHEREIASVRLRPAQDVRGGCKRLLLVWDLRPAGREPVKRVAHPLPHVVAAVHREREREKGRERERGGKRERERERERKRKREREKEREREREKEQERERCR